jgi:hypothetical protein
MATETERLCLDCHRRPLPKDGSRQRCVPCNDRHEQEVRDEEQEKVARRSRSKLGDPLNLCRYERLYRWKGQLVGITCGITSDGRTFAPAGFYYLEAGVSDEKAAKLGRKLVDMGLFQPGLDKPWVKRFKAMMKAASGREGEQLNWDGSM